MKEEKKDGKNKIKYIFSFYNFSEIPSFSSLIIYLLTFFKKKSILYRQSVYIYIYGHVPLCMAVAGRDKRLFQLSWNFFSYLKGEEEK
jgi:hypothetical protein